MVTFSKVTKKHPEENGKEPSCTLQHISRVPYPSLTFCNPNAVADAGQFVRAVLDNVAYEGVVEECVKAIVQYSSFLLRRWRMKICTQTKQSPHLSPSSGIVKHLENVSMLS